jgi:hypothetical protein
MQSSNHCRLSYPRNQGLIDRRGCCDPQRVTVKTSFAKEVPRFQDSDDCFLAALRNDGELDPARLNVKNCIRKFTLRKNDLILLIFRYCFSIAYFGEKYLWIERYLPNLLHEAARFPEQSRSSQVEYSNPIDRNKYAADVMLTRFTSQIPHSTPDAGLGRSTHRSSE